MCAVPQSPTDLTLGLFDKVFTYPSHSWHHVLELAIYISLGLWCDLVLYVLWEDFQQAGQSVAWGK